MKVEVWFDGGSRSNPNGQAASAAIVRDPSEGVTLRHVGRALGIASNNVAEWRGLIVGLETARELGATEVQAFGDSQLVVEQFLGNYQVNSEALKPLCAEARQLATYFPGGVKAKHVPRAQYHAADAICNAVLDGTYVGDGTLPVTETVDRRKPVSVAFVVEVTMNAKEVRDALAAGTTETALRKILAGRAERKLLLTGSVGGDTLRTARVKG
jgi:probable phosphoglycerate mutase